MKKIEEMRREIEEIRLRPVAHQVVPVQEPQQPQKKQRKQTSKPKEVVT